MMNGYKTILHGLFVTITASICTANSYVNIQVRQTAGQPATYFINDVEMTAPKLKEQFKQFADLDKNAVLPLHVQGDLPSRELIIVLSWLNEVGLKNILIVPEDMGGIRMQSFELAATVGADEDAIRWTELTKEQQAEQLNILKKCLSPAPEPTPKK